MMSRRLSLLLLLVLSVTPFTALDAQTFRGGIQGTITDSTGAAIPDALVTVKSQDTGLVRTLTSDSDGNYAITELPLGNYSVTAEKSGFRRATLRDVAVLVSINQRANLQLTPGEVKEAIEVTAEVPIVETAGNTLGARSRRRQSRNYR